MTQAVLFKALLTLAILSVLVLIHELGHFLAARFFGVKVLEFGVGIPPRAKVMFKKRGTEFTLNWLPLGGFVRLLGEDGGTKLASKDRKYAFSERVAWQKVIILTAGVIGNIILGVLLFAVVYSVQGVPTVTGKQVAVVGVAEGSPADLAGIKRGDVVIRIFDRQVETTDEFVGEINEYRGSLVRVYLGQVSAEGELADEVREVAIIPREVPPEGEGAIGVAVADVPIVRYDKKPWYTAPFYGVVEGGKEAFYWARAVLVGLVDVFGRLFRGIVPEEVVGPWGISGVAEEAWNTGAVTFIRFVAILSINLGIFNLLPIPALDGGRLVFVGLEKVVGRRKLEGVERVVHGLGFVLLIALLVAVTWKDIFGAS